MSGTTWTKFFWADWESDPALRLCSLAAQGLWMRMLCIAASHDPIGYVAVAGRGLDETALARMTGCSESEVAALLGELDRNGVFSRDRHRRIYSRRMVSDARKAATARKNGKNGGNPSLCKKRDIYPLDKGSDKGGLKPHKPEASIQKEERETDVSCPKPRKPRISYPDEFEEFWKGFPTDANMSKAEAFKVWKGLADDDKALAIASLPSFRRYCRDHATYRPVHACRYLAQRRFEGHAAGLSSPTTAARRPEDDPSQWGESQWRQALSYVRSNGSWDRDLGPPPGEPGCLAPRHLLNDRDRNLRQAA